jgi:ferredoxin, 2Fe-2S
MPQIILPQKNITLDVASDSNLMDVIMQAGIPVASSCHGDGVCSMCKMNIEVLDKSATLNSPEAYEIASLQRNKCSPDERLSCQIVVSTDLIVTTKYW